MPGQEAIINWNNSIWLPTYPSEFFSICNHILACLLGAVGGGVAQWLYSTRQPLDAAEVSRSQPNE